ncbi:MAG TPA: hypothetical protein VE173_13605 [Longimicrobiales bacterium]|jgi:V/A-type H+-transporting ATPase subunit E|nr:hypothetical protein [Longimicrobiales bacterium]
MNETGPPTAPQDDGTSSSGVEALIERLRQQGVEAGRAARAELVAEAEAKADHILREARDRAAAIESEARANAERLQAAGEDALRVAMRDAVLRMRETLIRRFEGQVRRLVAKQLVDEDFLRRVIVEAARRARDDAGVGEAEDVEVLLPREVLGVEEIQRRPGEMEGPLGRFAREIAGATWREGVTIGSLEPGSRGFRMRLEGEELEVDLTDRAVAELLLQHLQPRFRAILEGITW